jgi:hypothetical protein
VPAKIPDYLIPPPEPKRRHLTDLRPGETPYVSGTHIHIDPEHEIYIDGKAIINSDKKHAAFSVTLDGEGGLSLTMLLRYALFNDFRPKPLLTYTKLVPVMQFTDASTDEDPDIMNKQLEEMVKKAQERINKRKRITTDQKVKIVVKPVDSDAYITEIDNKLEPMQKLVGGLIEAVAPRSLKGQYGICNKARRAVIAACYPPPILRWQEQVLVTVLLSAPHANEQKES